MVSKLNAEERKDIKQILSIDRETQTVNVPITENISRGITQYKVVIPKKFATIIGLDKTKNQIQFRLIPPNATEGKTIYELIAKVIKR